MITIKNVTKKYNKRIILNDVSFVLKDSGFISLYGQSGCGKSTLLNILSSLDCDYEGEVVFDGVCLKELNESQKRYYRYKNFGFVFQSFNLFENQSVYQNLFLILSGNKINNKEVIDQKIIETLKFLDILSLKEEFVRNLSGGEKQRVAIARAIINNPKVLFCDEPTGALDNKNSDLVFKILKQLSRNMLIICVSHDLKRVKKYSDFIFDFNTHKLETNNPKEIETKEIISTKTNNSFPKISFSYIFSSIKQLFKMKKMRYFLSSSILSISLICLGISIFISNNVNKGINKAFSSIIDDKCLILRKKGQENITLNKFAANLNDIEKIYKFYSEDIDHIGTRYLTNFNDVFVDRNNFYISKYGYLKDIEFLKFQNIYNFKYQKSIKINSNHYILKEDEVGLSLNYQNMQSLCFALRIPRTFESLEEYIKYNDLNLILKTANYSWNYEDEQIIKVKFINKSSDTYFYHTNPRFNEIILEKYMRFPVTSNIDGPLEKPFILKKIHYIKTKYFQSDFLNKIQYDTKFKSYFFDIDNAIYSPNSCTIGKQCYSNRLFIYKLLNNTFDYSIIDTIKELFPEFNNYYFSSSGGYYNHGESIINGFINETFFASNEEDLNKIIDLLEKIDKENYKHLVYPENISKGYIYDNNNINVKFSTLIDGDYVGKNDIEIDEIIISSNLAKMLKIENPINKDLHILEIFDQTFDGKYYFHKFKKVKLKIKGVVDSNKCAIYHNSMFSISLFRDFFENDANTLIPTSIVYEFKTKPDANTINKINNIFLDYELIDPFKNVNKSIDEVFYYFNIVLLAFTIFSGISSIILLFVINTINQNEDKKDIAIFITLGFFDDEINKFQLMKIFSYTIPSLITSSISMTIISLFLKDTLSNSLNLNIPFSFPVYSIISIFVLTILITFISFVFMKKTRKTENYIKELH